MWQGKDLRERVFGSVAMIELSREFRGCVANKRLREKGKRKLGSGQRRGDTVADSYILQLVYTIIEKKSRRNEKKAEKK